MNRPVATSGHSKRWPWRAWVLHGLSVFLLLLGVGLTVFFTTDDIGLMLARHTLQFQIKQAISVWSYLPDPATLPKGALRGTVTNPAGQPVAGATVMVADWRGVTYRAVTDAAGRYQIEGVPTDTYRVVAEAPGYGPVADTIVIPTPFQALDSLRWRPAVSVLAGEVRTVDLQLTARQRVEPLEHVELSFGPEAMVEQGEPFPGRVMRQSFTLTTPWRSTEGLIYAPAAAGQYPTILVVYPGPPASWERVSIAMAQGGFTVVAYFPRNFPDIGLDVAELLALTDRLDAGSLTARAVPGRQCVAGGSFSTIWAFLLLRNSDAYRCGLSLGGISDAFLYRVDWEAGLIVPDPALAPVPQLMAALGPPNLAPDLYLWLSTVEHITELPPLLLVHGSGDTIVPINQSVVLAERLQAAGKPVELVLYSGMAHYLAADKADPDTVDLLNRTLAFFHRYLDQPGS